MQRLRLPLRLAGYTPVLLAHHSHCAHTMFLQVPKPSGHQAPCGNGCPASAKPAQHWCRMLDPASAVTTLLKVYCTVLTVLPQVPKPPQTVIADGKSGSSKQQEKQLREQREAYDAQLLHCGLALVLFWARWRRGEPIIVRESKVSQCEGTY